MVRRFRRRAIEREPDGSFIVRLPDHVRELLVDLGRQLDQALDHDDDPSLNRLFPTAYANDPERDAGFQVFARGELIESRREAISLLVETAERERLDEEQLTSWMHVVNDVRLVFGTRIDVSEDDHDLPDEDDPMFVIHLIYHQLGMVLAEIVDALMEALPEPTDHDIDEA